MPSPLNIVEYGPCRAIGMSCITSNPSVELPALWDKGVGPRWGEIAKPADSVALGICRCVPGTTDGTFEYIAAFTAKTDAAAPAGMIAIEIPRCHYAIFEVPGLKDIMAAWQRVQADIAAQSQWAGYCGPSGCQCASHPSFELYPATFPKDGRLWIYAPVRQA